MDTIFLAAVLGAIGGVARGVIGLLRALSTKKRIDGLYFVIMVVIAAIIAILVKSVFNFDPRLSFLTGYVGADVVEGIYRSFADRKILR